MNLNQTVILSPDVISQEVSGETVLLEEYEVEEAQLKADLEALLTDACERSLITLREAP